MKYVLTSVTHTRIAHNRSKNNCDLITILHVLMYHYIVNNTSAYNRLHCCEAMVIRNPLLHWCKYAPAATVVQTTSVTLTDTVIIKTIRPRNLKLMECHT